ncbi:MAG: Asp-tRNA(Asn)/Glu-tRNA(Gln) amidotransferase subunit GatC [Fuerstiella sp.]|nr:Asp-tRNA(Asn)/Glu-tRNA(Gln) amidotransferase subunit GatC [Fuerstiella sp.]
MERDEVLKVASLARLSLTDQEISRFGRQLTEILSYVETLEELDLEKTDPMPHAVDASNVFREDIQSDSLSSKAALANAPHTDGRFFIVPQILDQKDA